LRIVQDIMQDVQVRSELLPLLRTPLLGDLLAWVYLHPDEMWSVTDLATRLGVSQSTVSREADRLVRSNLITEQRRGKLRLVQANVQGPLAGPLTQLLVLTYGPKVVLGELLAAIRGVDEAYIYGSWAARYSGEAGPVPRDVDVLVVGNADDDDIFDAARVAERRLGREVNIRRVAARTWRANRKDPFLTSVRSRPLVPIDIEKEGP
jgi:DNA-binding transcriptional ArsR family regulator